MKWGLPLSALLATLAAGCGAHAQEPLAPPGEEPLVLRLSSPAFKEGTAIPTRFTCDGDDVSPELRWSGLPEGSRSLAVVVDDPDAPDPAAPQTTWVHWVLYNLPTSAHSLPEAVTAEGLPRGTREGRNDWGNVGYGGPCPPVGRHRYVHKIYALDKVLSDLDGPDKATLERAMEGHVLARAELVGTYERSR